MSSITQPGFSIDCQANSVSKIVGRFVRGIFEISRRQAYRCKKFESFIATPMRS